MESRERQNTLHQNLDNYQNNLDKSQENRIDTDSQNFQDYRPNKSYDGETQGSTLPDYKHTPPEPDPEQSTHEPIPQTRFGNDFGNSNENKDVDRIDNMERSHWELDQSR